MFQDIEPYAYHNEFLDRTPTENDYVFVLNKDKVVLDEKDGELSLLQFTTLQSNYPEAIPSLIYLFSVDQSAFFLSMEEIVETDQIRHKDIHVFREMKPTWLAFAGATAYHLAHWYDTHRYCGRCAAPFERKNDERAVICPSCGNIDYPRISPCVIVGIIDGDRILLTKYASSYKRYALVAGFVEIGETLEAAIRREVMEEVGLKVKNIRYYKSQPWAFSSSLLAGFFADLDGDDTITMDTKELSEAVWIHRDELPTNDSSLSLTWNMIETFRNRKE